MGLLETIDAPRNLRALNDEQLTELTREIRDFLIAKVSRTGGHLGPNLGVVELTLAVHRVFDSPHDRVIFDTGHQAYVHKMLTGRASGFDTLRQQGGLSGYPSRSESPHDVVENSHASTGLSYADGLAKAYALRGEDRHVVAVVGDGALTGGMAWEALNNIAANKTRPLVIIVNDNGRSYTPTVGALAEHLASLRTDPRYEQVLELVKSKLGRTPLVGQSMYDVLHGIKRGLKDVLAPQGLFEDLGFKYLGPIDGHDRVAVEQALENAKGFGGPVIVHCLTKKGFGYSFAELDEADRLHSPAAFDPDTGPVVAPAGTTWTHVLRDELVVQGEQHPHVVAITAAMLHPTGLDAFAGRFPDRTFDVGIAEQHAVTSAAGLAMGGMHPVVAIYSTFLNRAFDQVLMDVALHQCGVTFVLDRAGVTGEDGPSHHGMWDLSLLQVVPGLRIAAPRDGRRLRELLGEAIGVDDAPTVVRFPRGSVPNDIEAVDRVGGCDVLVRAGGRDVLLVSMGAMATICLDVAERLTAQGIGVTLVDPRWVKPVDAALADLAATHRIVVSVEDGIGTGGCGSALAETLREKAVETPVRVFALPARFLDHAPRAAVLAQAGLTAQDIAREVVEAVAVAAGETLDERKVADV